MVAVRTCDVAATVALRNTVDSELGSSSLTRHWGDIRVKVVKV